VIFFGLVWCVVWWWDVWCDYVGGGEEGNERVCMCIYLKGWVGSGEDEGGGEGL
jgi:hypothetical protein